MAACAMFNRVGGLKEDLPVRTARPGAGRGGGGPSTAAGDRGFGARLESSRPGPATSAS